MTKIVLIVAVLLSISGWMFPVAAQQCAVFDGQVVCQTGAPCVVSNGVLYCG